jgi:soluble cytochrome b562
MKPHFIFTRAALLLALAVCSFAGQTEQNNAYSFKMSAELEIFDALVLQSRQEMRKSCALMQELMKEFDELKQAAAIEHIQKSVEKWQKLEQKYQNQPPAEYRADTTFAARLAAIHQAMNEMENELAKGDVQLSFKACAKACGLFVQMHEENNLVYAADRLFHLRKLAKQIIDLETKSGISAIQPLMRDLLELRDAVVLAPCPAPHNPERCSDYQAALKTLSAQLDELAMSAINGREKTVKVLLQNLVETINVAYAIAL